MEKKRTDTAVLRMHCPDQPGIIAVITEFITSNRGNILYLDQYVDRAAGIFYMRVEWDIADFLIPKEKLKDYFDTLYATRYELHLSSELHEPPSAHGHICVQDVTLSL